MTEQETLKRAQIMLEPETHRALKILAAERGTTISELVRDAVSQVYGEEIEERTGRR